MFTVRKAGTVFGALACVALAGGCAELREEIAGPQTAQAEEPIAGGPFADEEVFMAEEPQRAELAQAPAAPVTVDAPLNIGPEGIRLVQEQLNQEGYDIAVDGIWGPETASAVRQFQQRQGLEPTGTLTLATLGEMGVELQQLTEADQGGQPQQATTPAGQPAEGGAAGQQ